MYFDILMPAVLFTVTLVAMFLSKKAETKLKATVEEREFRSRDIIMLVTMIAIAVSIIAFIPSIAILAIFLFSYSSLLFTFTYAYSDMNLKKLTLYCSSLIIASIIAILAGFSGILSPEIVPYGEMAFTILTIAFTILAFCAFSALLYAHKKSNLKQKWYVAALTPAMFILLLVFFRGSAIWDPYLINVYGIMFAMLIVIYLGSMFSWKTVFLFAGFLTGIDILLVWVTGTMLTAAQSMSGLGLPVLVAFPTVPWISTETGILLMRLGLGDFFFAGILGTQTWKKFDKKTAIISLIAMTISFGLFELFLLNPELAALLPKKALPATLPIVLGWLPVVVIKLLQKQKSK
jgi:hypothetical protein